MHRPLFPVFLLIAALVLPATTAEDPEAGTPTSTPKTQGPKDEAPTGSEKYGVEERPEEESEQEEWEDEERHVETDVDDEGFHVESRRESERGNDALKAEFEAQTGRLRVEFEQEGPMEARFELELDGWRIIEFRDDDGDGAFEPGEATLRTARIDDAVAREVQATPGPDGTQVDVTYRLSPGGTWHLSFWIPERAQQKGGIDLSATEIKFDIAIRDFPYSAADSRVAVQFRLQAESEFEEGTKDGLPGLLAAGQDLKGYLRWATNSTVDGVDRAVGVHASAIRFGADDGETEREALVTFAYARGQDILHDPSIGVALASVTPRLPLLAPWADVTWLIMGAAAVVILVAFTLGPRLRTR